MKHLEETIQRYVVTALERLERDGVLSYEADMGGRLRNTARQVEQAKQLGWRPGTMDMTIFIKGGKVVRFELKTPTGTLKKTQRERRAIMEDLGYEVHTIRVATGQQAWEQMVDILWPHIQAAFPNPPEVPDG